jgi:hypothetical protein
MIFCEGQRAQETRESTSALSSALSPMHVMLRRFVPRQLSWQARSWSYRSVESPGRRALAPSGQYHRHVTDRVARCVDRPTAGEPAQLGVQGHDHAVLAMWRSLPHSTRSRRDDVASGLTSLRREEAFEGLTRQLRHRGALFHRGLLGTSLQLRRDAKGHMR